MKFIRLHSFLVALMCSKSLFASIAISFEFEAFRDSSSAPLATETLSILVVDTDKNSIFPSASDLLGTTLSVGDYINNDRIFYSGRTGDGAINNATLSDSITGVTGNDLGLASNSEIENTRWAVYWFPGLSAAPSVGGLQSGQEYGFFHSDQIDSTAAASFNATASMVMPPDTATAVNTFYFDTATENTSFPSVQDFTADLTVVPEPSLTLLLSTIGVLVLFRRRH